MTTFAGPVRLLVGALDLFHALSFEGVHVVTVPAPDASIQFWVAARLLEGLALAAAMVLPLGWLHRPALAGAIVVVAGLELLTILLGVFPTCYVPGQGLTFFKVGSEILVTGMKMLGAVVIVRRQPLAPPVRRLVMAALLLSAVSGLAFALYHDVHDQFVVAGHLLKVAAFYLLYAPSPISPWPSRFASCSVIWKTRG